MKTNCKNHSTQHLKLYSVLQCIMCKIHHLPFTKWNTNMCQGFQIHGKLTLKMLQIFVCTIHVSLVMYFCNHLPTQDLEKTPCLSRKKNKKQKASPTWLQEDPQHHPQHQLSCTSLQNTHIQYHFIFVHVGLWPSRHLLSYLMKCYNILFSPKHVLMVLTDYTKWLVFTVLMHLILC